MFETGHYNNVHDRRNFGGDKESAGGATVLLVDDEPAVRKSLSRLVRSAGYLVETFATGAELLRHELPTGPTCVLLDLQMEGMTGAEVHEALRRNNRHVQVIFLSGAATVSSAVAEVKHGAADFLEKPVQPGVLIAAVKRAVEADRAESEERANQAGLEHRFATLTPREQEVMRLVVSGMLNKQSAAELGISEKTIKVHRARVMEKMNVEALAPLVLMAERLGLTEPAEAFVAY
jgi:FixJ family two-component response regulator